MKQMVEAIDWPGLQQLALHWSGRIALALLLFWIGKWLARRISLLIGRVVERTGRDPMLAGFVRNLVFGLGLAVVAVAALDQLGIPNASLLTALGAAGLAIGLSLQSSLSNLASGVLLILFRPFRTHDFIEAAGQSGSVESLSLLFTVLTTGDNRQVTIPNSQVMGGPIVNYSARGTRRIDLLIGIAYESDIDQALQLIDRVLKAEPRLLAEPEAKLLVLNLGESSVDIGVRPWVRGEDYWAVRSDLLARIKRDLAAAGIDIPYPQRTLRIVSGEATR